MYVQQFRSFFPRQFLHHLIPRRRQLQMALKAVHATDVPNLDQVPENASSSLYSPRFVKGVECGRATSFKAPKFLVIGHRGNGMNMLQSSDLRMRAVKENTVLSFNTAANYPVDFIEFDVQVLKDGCPIIFHDNFIYAEDIDGTVHEKRVTELSLSEFLTYGPLKEEGLTGKKLLRKTKEGKMLNWNVESDDSACTLREAFEKVNPSIGFNIELKFDDNVVYEQENLTSSLQAILRVVTEYTKDRRIIFSSFHPHAALIVKKLQNSHPVFFLTNGGNEIYDDVRRNSLEEAIKVCLEGGLQGIVSEVRGVFRNPASVKTMKDLNLSLLTYGRLNNVPEAVYMQHLMGVEGVIVDFVEEITEAVSRMVKQPSCEEGDEEEQIIQRSRPQFSHTELSFLFKLIPELVQK